MNTAAIDDTLLLHEDEIARVRALELASFIVEAPAGAGKTELISQRYLVLLTTVAHPEEIVAITFTKKAAAEMRNRILGNLQLAACGERPVEPHRQKTFELATAVLARSAELGWQLLDQPGRLRILTIDALCGSLARQMPLLSRFGSQPEITDQPEPLYQEAAGQTLALLESDLPGVSEVVAASLAYLDNDVGRLARMLAEMLGKRDQWLHNAHGIDEPAWESDDVLRLLVEAEITEAATLIDVPMQHTLMPLARYAADNVDDSATLALLRGWTASLPTDHESLPMWRAVCELLLTAGDDWRKSFNKTVGFPPGAPGKPYKDAITEVVESLRALTDGNTRLARLRRLPLALPREDDAAIVHNFSALLRLATASLWQVFQARGQTDFVEVAQRALQALEDDSGPTDLALRLDYRLQHLLVDEFQDTSPVQIRLLERLTAGWTADDGRTLFCVGDPMQSIYRFRKADVGLFLQAARNGIGAIALQRLQLTRNNRSCPEVVDWINRGFAALFPTADNVARGAIRYRPFVATRRSMAGAGVEVHALLVSGEMDGARVGQIEATRMLDIIDQTWSESPARDIAVLVRARSHLAPLVAEIRAQRPDLRYQAVEIEALGGRQWISDLITLARAMLHRADRIAWLALLRAPWCGLTLADLHVLAGDDRDATLWSLMNDDARCARLSEDGRDRLAHVRRVVDEAFAQAGRQRVARWIEGVWLQLDGPALLPDASAAQDVEAWFGLVERLDARRVFSLERLQVEVDRLYAAPDPGADGRLRFMTIHKSKGLEFDTVIVPGLHRSAGQTDTPLLRWEEVPTTGTETGLIVAPLSSRSSNGEGVSPYQYLQRLEAERAGNEDLRVLYVAATRAVRALHLFGACVAASDSGEPKVPGGTPLRMLWPVLEPAFAAASLIDDGSQGMVEMPSYEDFVPHLVRLRNPGVPAVLSASRGAERAAPAHETDEADVASGGGGRYRLEASVGTLVHRYLELIARSGATGWAPARVAGLRPAMLRWLGLQGLTGIAADAAAARVITMLCRTLDSETGQWILAQRDEAASELALAMHSEDAIRVHVIDRSFVEDGTRWIIDFKSASLAETAKDADFAAHAEQYRAQLARYAGLFAGEVRALRCAIYYTSHDRLVELQFRSARKNPSPSPPPP